MVFFSAIPENFHVMNQLRRNSRMGARAYYAEILLAIAACLCDIVWLSKYHSGSEDWTTWMYASIVIVEILLFFLILHN